MSYRDNFSSDMKSPGNYAGNTTYGNSGYRGGYGGTNNPGLGYTTPAQRNFAAQGGSFGRGFGFGSLGASENNIGRGPWPGGYATPVLQGQVPPVRPRMPVPTALPPAVTQEDIPGVVQPPPPAPFTGFTDAMMFRDAFEPARNRQWGQYATRPGTYPGQTGSNTTTIYKNPNGGGYTNINKNNQGNLAGYPGGNQSTYARMGSDFRSIDSW